MQKSIKRDTLRKINPDDDEVVSFGGHRGFSVTLKKKEAKRPLLVQNIGFLTFIIGSILAGVGSCVGPAPANPEDFSLITSIGLIILISSIFLSLAADEMASSIKNKKGGN